MATLAAVGGYLLLMGTPAHKIEHNDELKDLCKAMANMAPYEITASDRTVELNQSPANVLAAIKEATRAQDI